MRPMDYLIEAVRAHAAANYNTDGWDYVVEAWDDDQIEEAIEDAGATDAPAAIAAVGAQVKLIAEIEYDIRNA